MLHNLITIQVTGFTQTEAQAGLPDLLAEFGERPWLLNPLATWDEASQSILIQIERAQEDGDRNGEGTLDEVWDCVIATIDFSSPKITFRIVSIQPLDDKNKTTNAVAG